MWNPPAPPGFAGLREDRALEVYVRHLPHWRQEGATYFATLRLADSLPQVKLDELASLRREWQQTHPPPWPNAILEKLGRQVAEKVERWLDQGMGACLLKDPRSAVILRDAMLHFHGIRYDLGAFVIMPNHAHVLVRPLQSDKHPLEEILGSWKQFSSTQINLRTGGKGALWQDESYDRIVRDEEHLYRCLQYIGRNPRLAKLILETCLLWVKPEWVSAGWNFEDDG